MKPVIIIAIAVVFGIVIGLSLNVSAEEGLIPSWIKNNAKWWVDGQIDDEAFIQGIQFLIKEGTINISSDVTSDSKSDGNIPLWVRNNASWWAEGVISEDDFVNGIEFLVTQGIIQVQ